MNWPTLIIALLVAAAFVTIVVRGVRNRKKGKSGCSCGCADCGMKGSCHND